jgi:ABC-type transport system involved in multi-copper enzyme maturation permease subunit
VFWSSVEIPREIDRKEVHVYLAKPITRMRYLLGKYLGMTGMVLAAEVFLMLVFTGCLVIKGRPPTSVFWSGAARMALFLTLLNAVCVAASMLLSEVKAMVTVLTIMAAAGLMFTLAVLAWSSYDTMPAMLFSGAYHLLPDLLHYRWDPAAGQLLPYLASLLGYTIGWSTLCLIIAAALFERMDLP